MTRRVKGVLVVPDISVQIISVETDHSCKGTIFCIQNIF